MSNLHFAGAMSHAPGIAAFRDAASPAQRQAFFGGTDALREAAGKARLDALVVIAPDHFSNFFIDNMPACCVSMNESYMGPVENWLGMDKYQIKGDAELARLIMHHAYAAGIEPASSAKTDLEHSVIVPLSLITPKFDVPVVWVMMNCQVPPLMSLRRCYELGKAIRAAIEASGKRVGVLGSGGLSHAPGAPEADTLDPDFDRYFLDLLDRNAVDKILAIPPERLDAAGFGSWEIRLWVAALGAAHDRRPRTLAYEPIVEWDTGCAVAIYE
ncbi:MAG: hypothetical protein QHC78_03065 [Pigmentiphaga sp.]|uniref:DODA-type extradiol aromatic ring-opening family dioxygenase n=1 Tax=Pigmentiphaga sp. TaxID=1977564 RepID=UPI0029BB6475|nr:hypothetical protein [Pigmentiphaga sp.]MDX3904654.1 hypothetical protein [Pigmentiphaga sp.]